MTWQLIDTAPKDGTHVLVLAGHGAVEAFWRNSPSITGKYPPAEGWAYREPCGGLVPLARDVAYWMPLQERPA